MSEDLIVTIPVSEWPRPTERSVKIMCPLCGVTGYSTYSPPSPTHWSYKHLGLHARCPDCGKVFLPSGIGKHMAWHREQDSKE